MPRPPFTVRPSLTRLEDRDNPSGNLDLSFSGTGKVAVDFGDDDTANAMAVQSDGKVVVAGTRDPSDLTCDMIVARFNANGTLDTTFGTAGRVTLSLTVADWCHAVAVQADGKIVLAGFTGTGGSGADFAVVRLNADGTLDTSFGGTGTGWRAVDFGASEEARALVIQPDGKIVLAGVTGVSSTSAAVARLDATGALDTTFDADGLAILSPGTAAECNAVALQPDGKIVGVGFEQSVGDPLTTDMLAFRLTATGGLDTTFDGDGFQRVDFFSGTDGAEGVTVQADGKIVLVGYA